MPSAEMQTRTQAVNAGHLFFFHIHRLFQDHSQLIS